MAKDRSKPARQASDPRKLRYEVAYDLVIDLISTRGLKPGDKLPSATELAALAEVSMISVRHALDKLENEGRIRRHQGIGTFVTRERIVSEPSRPGELLRTLTDADHGPELSTKIIHIGVGLPGRSVEKALSIAAGQPVWEVVRLRSLAARPAIIEHAIMPLSLVPSLDQTHIEEGGSLYRFLAETHGLSDEHSEQFFEVVQPSKLERELLGLTGRDHVVRIRGVSFTGEGVAFDCWQQTYLATDFVFYSSGSGSRHFLQSADISPWDVTPLRASPGKVDTGFPSGLATKK